MTGKMALQIVLDNSGGCTEKLAMTRAWGDRYRAEATGYMRRKAYYFKRQFWATRISLQVNASLNRTEYDELDADEIEGEFHWNKERGFFEHEVYSDFTRTYYLPPDPMDQPPASEANKWEKEAREMAERYYRLKKNWYYIMDMVEKVPVEMEPEWPFESALAEAEAQFKLDCAMEP